MKKFSFKGGVHPNDHKKLSAALPIELLDPGDELVFPLSQHIGAPATPIVKKGDQVLVGQIIAQKNGFISANVASSVSGVVKAIDSRLVPSGFYSDCIIITNDHQYQTIENYNTLNDYHNYSSNQIRELIELAGIVGLGGAGFPSAVKDSPKDAEAIKYIIINGAECEPYLTSDYRLMLEETDKLIEGIKIQLKLFKNAKAIIAIEDNKPLALKHLNEVIKDEPKIEVAALPTKYPQGSERVLIKVLTGQTVVAGMLPADVGCIVNNVASIIAIYDAVALNIPLIEKIVTVTGDAINQPKNFKVRLGTKYQVLVDACDGFKVHPQKIISGGPMMGTALFNLEIPVSKTSSALVCLSEDEVSKATPTACIHCGRCVDGCPIGLIPQMLYRYARIGDKENFIKVHGMDCMECGCCTYSCPAKRNMTQSFKRIKKAINDDRKKGAK